MWGNATRCPDDNPPEVFCGHRYINTYQVVFTVIHPWRRSYSMKCAGRKAIAAIRILTRLMLF